MVTESGILLACRFEPAFLRTWSDHFTTVLLSREWSALSDARHREVDARAPAWSV